MHSGAGGSLGVGVASSVPVSRLCGWLPGWRRLRLEIELGRRKGMVQGLNRSVTIDPFKMLLIRLARKVFVLGARRSMLDARCAHVLHVCS